MLLYKRPQLTREVHWGEHKCWSLSVELWAGTKMSELSEYRPPVLCASVCRGRTFINLIKESFFLHLLEHSKNTVPLCYTCLLNLYCPERTHHCSSTANIFCCLSHWIWVGFDPFVHLRGQNTCIFFACIQPLQWGCIIQISHHHKLAAQITQSVLATNYTEG